MHKPVILTLGSSMGILKVQDQPRLHREFEASPYRKGVSIRKDGRETGEERGKGEKRREGSIGREYR